MLSHNLSSIVDGYAADHEINPNTTASGNAIFYIKRYIIFGRFLKWMLSKIIYIFAMVQFLAI